MLNTPPKTPLLTILRELKTDERRDEFAALAGTSRLYLYQLSGCHSGSCRAKLAMGIANASVEMNKRYGTPVIDMQTLATMCPIPSKAS